ncbi:Cytochrome P450 [Canna indica]|uniref:Cytochrome P450 n=1 Tax=Canna indica TaxID=4628 RepID=A0AAQ3QSY6_9LILI|nr:Cytochrome P450 [Canna indica]
MARAEQVWGTDCREFKLERWLDEKEEFLAVEVVRFPVFHAGPRFCLGIEMENMQMKAIVVVVIRRFWVEPVRLSDAKGGDVSLPEYEMTVTLRIKGGFPI